MKLVKVGGSFYLRVPKELLEHLNWCTDDCFSYDVNGNDLVYRKVR